MIVMSTVIYNKISLIVIALFSLCNPMNNKTSNECKMCGEWTWEKNDENHDFNLKIYTEGEYIIGKHCYITDNGNKMDCSTDKNDISFKIKNTNLSNLKVDFTSFFRGAKGIIEIQLKDNKLIWTVVQKPNDIYYLPLEAVLIKSKN